MLRDLTTHRREGRTILHMCHYNDHRPSNFRTRLVQGTDHRTRTRKYEHKLDIAGLNTCLGSTIKMNSIRGLYWQSNHRSALHAARQSVDTFLADVNVFFIALRPN